MKNYKKLNLISGILTTLVAIKFIAIGNYGFAIILGIFSCINLSIAFSKDV